MNNFTITVSIITLIGLIILIVVLKNIDSKEIKEDDPKYKTNSPFNIFLGIIFIIVIIGFFLTSMSLCANRNSSRDIFIEDPIRRP